MGKKKGSAPASKTAAKAAKKLKATQKTEKKEKKKASKSKEDAEDDEDLEGILERVSLAGIGSQSNELTRWCYSVDAKRMGGGAHRHRGARRGSAKPTRQRDPDRVSEWQPSLVHRR